MEATWKIIETWLADKAPHLSGALNRGATQEAVDKFEALTGAKLPADFVAFYKIHNGQDNDMDWLMDGEELLSMERITDEWKSWKELQHDFKGDDGKPYTSNPEAGIKADWWNPLWIPVTYNGGGDHICLDLDPAPGGKIGQMIRLWHDDPVRSLEADSFREWITEFATGLQQGEYVYSKDWGAIINKEEAEL